MKIITHGVTAKTEVNGVHRKMTLQRAIIDGEVSFLIYIDCGDTENTTALQFSGDGSAVFCAFMAQAPAKLYCNETANFTPWFPSTIKPYRDGVYEVDRRVWGTSDVRYSLWRGGRWGTPRQTIQQAAQEVYPSEYQYKEWRGLTGPSE